MTLARIADYRVLICRAAKNWQIRAAQRNGTANPKRIGIDALFKPLLQLEEFGAYALFIVAHL
jgi:hypothetical protein